MKQFLMILVLSLLWRNSANAGSCIPMYGILWDCDKETRDSWEKHEQEIRIQDLEYENQRLRNELKRRRN